MSDQDLLAALPGFAYDFVLLLARFGALVMLAPGLGETQCPLALRAAIAAALCLLLLPVLGPALPSMPPAAWALAGTLAAELATGLWFGWLARLVALALPAAAHIISYMVGLSSVIAPDPSGGQTTALSRLFGLVPPLLVLGSGLYAVPLAALVASYRLIPAGTLMHTADAVPLVVRAVSASFSVSLQLAAPFVLAGTIWQIALGITARLVPSLQVYQLALPGQVLGGLLLLAVTLPTLLMVWMAAARTGLAPLTGG